jgi:glucosamine--fructose-6-phosphate aminotransferase (isomerizing)
MERVNAGIDNSQVHGREGVGILAEPPKESEAFARKDNALILGRGLRCPIALEALELKGISHIPAEAYPAGELKHGPLALVTAEMPVVTVAPHDAGALSPIKQSGRRATTRSDGAYRP